MSQFSFIGSIIFSILFIILGLGMVAHPTGVVVAITIFISIMMILSGIANIGIFSAFRGTSGSIYYLIDGIISILIGILIISSDDALQNFVPYLIGFWLVLKGVSTLVASFELKRRLFNQWGYMLIGGILVTILGVVVIFFPIIVQVYIGVVVGVISIIAGAVGLVLALRFRKMSEF